MSAKARRTIVIATALLGVLLISIGPFAGNTNLFFVLGALSLLVAIAIFTEARMGQFFGSVAGSAAFLFGLVYLVNELISGPLFAEKGSEPSKFNAIMFFIVFGLPGAAFAISAKFGLRKDK